MLTIYPIGYQNLMNLKPFTTSLLCGGRVLVQIDREIVVVVVVIGTLTLDLSQIKVVR